VLTAYLNSAYSKLSENDFELTQAHLKAVDLDFVKTVLSPFFSRFYDHSGKLSKNILSKIAASQKNEASLSELCDYLKKENNELSPHLAKLVQDGAILRIDRGRYKLFHHLLGEYVRFKEQSN
jgi:hypothetical protein